MDHCLGDHPTKETIKYEREKIKRDKTREEKQEGYVKKRARQEMIKMLS
jgi:hypothetical protein